MHASVCPSGFVCVITLTCMHGFQNYMTQLLSLGRRNATETFLRQLKVKVTLEGHINELLWAITPTYMHGFQNNFAQVFSLKRVELPFETFVHARTLYPPPPFTPPPPPPPPPPPHQKKKKKRKKKDFFVRLGFLVNL